MTTYNPTDFQLGDRVTVIQSKDLGVLTIVAIVPDWYRDDEDGVVMICAFNSSTALASEGSPQGGFWLRAGGYYYPENQEDRTDEVMDRYQAITFVSSIVVHPDNLRHVDA